MNFLEERIVKDGIVKEGNILKVDSFLNHQMDVQLFQQMGEEFKRRFADKEINKILTIEASGIGIACIVASCFHVPVVFAKKSKSVNIDGAVYVAEVESFTHKCKNQVIVSKKFLHPEDKVLIIDDFLANGCALQGLISIVTQAGATVEGHRYRCRKGLSAGRPHHPESGLSAGIAGNRGEHGRIQRNNCVPGAGTVSGVPDEKIEFSGCLDQQSVPAERLSAGT